MAIALLLGAYGLARSGFGTNGFGTNGFGTNGPSETGVRSTVTADARATDAGTGQPSAAEEALFGAINRARTDRGLAALAESAPLGRAARAHSADLKATSRCSHDGSDGSSLEDRLAAVEVNLQRYGEVVACGSASADAAVEQWLASSAHRDILLGRGFRTVGVGVALGANAADGRWTAVLGTP
ncbi:MAG: CAP domain-containing protein [Ardenticatenales bacterium]